jgi:ABC-type uncharacterized transport system YnjBCD substrate-binding protein
MTYNESTKKLIPFFRKLAADIENNELDMTQLLNAGEMFMFYNFSEHTTNTELTEKDIQKYLVTGWYIYNQLPITPETDI